MAFGALSLVEPAAEGIALISIGQDIMQRFIAAELAVKKATYGSTFELLVSGL
ncbi:MAG: hypothetical protein JWR80_8407 [Bradyrhizobium sp.]|nr:hypothetical protein [Bradyrhizobium sp.]